MKYATIILRPVFYALFCLFSLVLSCTDHEVPETPNDPESECMLLNGTTPRQYACEFKIEKLTFYNKDGGVIGDVTPTSSEITLKRSDAKSDSNPSASAVDDVGSLTYDVKVTIKRIANPSFPVIAGYQLRYSTHPSGVMALTTPGESYQYGSSVMLPMAIGASMELPLELSYLYHISNTMSGLKPTTFRGLTAFLIYNDATAADLDMHPSLIGNVAEAYVKIVTKSGE